MLFLAMLILGAVIGFVGGGGAGVTIALLTVGFDVPTHTALAVALAAMSFTMLSGTVSHLREGNVMVKTGAILGAGGLAGAFFGAEFSSALKGELLHYMTAIMLLLSALAIYVKLYHENFLNRYFPVRKEPLAGRKLYVYGIICGAVNGFISGAFGIGAAMFIQLTLMFVFGVPVFQAIGTCMMIVLPISISGSLAYLFNGYLDWKIFVQTMLGLTAGAFIGAKFTRVAPRSLLRAMMVALPAWGALSMLLRG